MKRSCFSSLVLLCACQLLSATSGHCVFKIKYKITSLCCILASRQHYTFCTEPQFMKYLIKLLKQRKFAQFTATPRMQSCLLPQKISTSFPPESAAGCVQVFQGVYYLAFGKHNTVLENNVLQKILRWIAVQTWCIWHSHTQTSSKWPLSFEKIMFSLGLL